MRFDLVLTFWAAALPLVLGEAGVLGLLVPGRGVPGDGDLLTVQYSTGTVQYSCKGDLLQPEDGLLHLQSGVPSLEARSARR